MRTLIGWTLALVASALVGASVYQAVLADPTPRAVAEPIVQPVQPLPTPTITHRVVRTVVEPTPTITVDRVVADQAPPRRSTATEGSTALRPTPAATRRSSTPSSVGPVRQGRTPSPTRYEAQRDAEAAEQAAERAAEAAQQAAERAAEAAKQGAAQDDEVED